MFVRLPFDYAARNLGRSPVRAVVTVAGAAGVIFLVILMVGFVRSLRSMMRSTGDAANVIVLGSGSEDFLEQSEIQSAVPSIVGSTVRGIARHNGIPLVSAEIHHATSINPAGAPDDEAARLRRGLIRGVTPVAFLVHRQVYLDHGRIPAAPGEIVVGPLVSAKLGIPAEELSVGNRLRFEGREWEIVGHIAAPGTAFETEIWAPLEELKAAVRRETITCAIARLENPGRDYAAVQVFTKTRLDLEINAVTEVEYYSRLSAFFWPVEALGWAMAGLVVLAGMFGGLNTMIAAIAGRVQEIGCLETIGFSRGAIVLSLLQEAWILAGTGALVAAGVALFALRGMAVQFTMGVVSLDVDTAALAAGVGAAAVLATAGTLIPASRLARANLVEMLRS